MYAYILFLLLPADLILITTILFQNSSQSPLLDMEHTNGEALTYSSSLLILLLGFASVKLRDTRLISLFIVLYWLDAIINLIRVYTVLQFCHFIAQILICQSMRFYGLTLQASWFTPT